HPREAELHAAMRDVAGRAESVLMDHHHRGFQRIGELRAFHRTRAAMAQARRSSAPAFEGLPPVVLAPADGVLGAAVLAAIEAAETHDDLGPLDKLVGRLERDGSSPGLTHLVRARRHLVTGDLNAAVRDLELAARASDRHARQVRPQVLATRGLL